MNYIKKLEQENKEKQEQLNKIEENIHDLMRYLNSEKFQGEGELQGYVNVKDVIQRLMERNN